MTRDERRDYAADAARDIQEALAHLRRAHRRAQVASFWASVVDLAQAIEAADIARHSLAREAPAADGGE